MKLESQDKAILDYLKSGRSLTPYQALTMFGSFRLASRIHRLKSWGNDIKDEWYHTDSGKRVKRYFIRERDYH